jgi:hypothetical protein
MAPLMINLRVPFGYAILLPLQDGDFRIELLFDPRVHGKLFLHGILLRPMCDSPQQHINFGVNYIGSTQALQSYDLSRDPTTINMSLLLCDLLIKAIHLLAVNARPEQWCVLAHVYDALSKVRGHDIHCQQHGLKPAQPRAS